MTPPRTSRARWQGADRSPVVVGGVRAPSEGRTTSPAPDREEAACERRRWGFLRLGRRRGALRWAVQSSAAAGRPLHVVVGPGGTHADRTSCWPRSWNASRAANPPSTSPSPPTTPSAPRPRRAGGADLVLGCGRDVGPRGPGRGCWPRSSPPRPAGRPRRSPRGAHPAAPAAGRGLPRGRGGGLGPAPRARAARPPAHRLAVALGDGGAGDGTRTCAPSPSTTHGAGAPVRRDAPTVKAEVAEGELADVLPAGSRWGTSSCSRPGRWVRCRCGRCGLPPSSSRPAPRGACWTCAEGVRSSGPRDRRDAPRRRRSPRRGRTPPRSDRTHATASATSSGAPAGPRGCPRHRVDHVRRRVVDRGAGGAGETVLTRTPRGPELGGPGPGELDLRGLRGGVEADERVPDVWAIHDPRTTTAPCPRSAIAGARAR